MGLAINSLLWRVPISLFLRGENVKIKRKNFIKEAYNIIGVEMKKILTLLIIATVLMAIPLASATSRPPLNKIVFVYREGFAKPPGTPGKGPSGDKNDYYAFLGKGVKWKDLPVNYVIDPDNPDVESFVVEAISNGAEEWDAHTDVNLFGSYTIVYDATFDTDSPDGRNELLFGNWPEENVIAVTVVWGYFRGPPQQREIIEFDIMFDTDFNWGYAGDTSETELGDTSIMDLQNIATHEFGHGAGLADLYADECSEQTMYGYADYGETKKRTLNTGDIAGIQALYD